MTVQTMNQLNNSTHYAAVYVEGNTDSPHLPKRVPTKKRMRMIAKEMNEILDGAQDYLLRHMLDDDLSGTLASKSYDHLELVLEF